MRTMLCYTMAAIAMAILTVIAYCACLDPVLTFFDAVNAVSNKTIMMLDKLVVIFDKLNAVVISLNATVATIREIRGGAQWQWQCVCSTLRRYVLLYLYYTCFTDRITG